MGTSLGLHFGREELAESSSIELAFRHNFGTIFRTPFQSTKWTIRSHANVSSISWTETVSEMWSQNCAEKQAQCCLILQAPLIRNVVKCERWRRPHGLHYQEPRG
jgi:hypothetical protein